MNREYELISYLREPVRCLGPPRWNKIIPFNVRWINKSWGGRAKGRWLVFKDKELAFHKPFPDSLVATLAAKSLLIPFSKENDRAFFLRESVEPYIAKTKTYCYNNYEQAMAAYRRS